MRAGADRRCHPHGERWRRPAIVHRRIASTGFRADPFLGRCRPSGRTCVRSRSTTSQVSGALAYADVPEAARFHLGPATNVAKINQNGAVKAALDAVPIPRDRGTLEINLLAAYWLGREGSNLRMAESKSAALPLGYAPTLRPEPRTGRPPETLRHHKWRSSPPQARDRCRLRREYVAGFGSKRHVRIHPRPRLPAAAESGLKILRRIPLKRTLEPAKSPCVEARRARPRGVARLATRRIHVAQGRMLRWSRSGTRMARSKRFELLTPRFVV